MRWSHMGDRVTATFLLIGMALALSLSGMLTRIDNVIYDAAQRYIKRDMPSDIVMVTIDEQSLSSLGRWPWSRRSHAQVVERLHADGAKVIGLDVMFAEPQNDDADADHILAKALSDAGNVVLPVVIEKVRGNGQLIETLPLASLVEHAAALGRVHAELDADAIARSITLWEGLGAPVWPHFAQAMLATAGQLPMVTSVQPSQVEHADPTALHKQQQRYINFSSNRQHIQSLSFVHVLRGEFNPGTFNGKLVLVGSTAAGMADNLPTPVSGYQQPMPGVEFLANSLASMRANTLVTQSPLWANVLISCILAALPMLWLPKVRASLGLMSNIGFALALIGVAMAMPLWLYVWMPLSPAVLGVLAAYPVWAWRKLESASEFLDTELNRLQQELSMADPFSPSQHEGSQWFTDPFQKRIEQVRAATAQLKCLENAQRETLAFISHDIRVPLASAAAQLGEKHPVYGQLSRALAWTEDYLQTSRVQMLKLEAFVELDIANLLHEVADEVFPLTTKAGLVLILDLPDHPIWILGHRETLTRAIVNLLTNAIKFSPLQGQIQLSAQCLNAQVRIQVSDQGPGIAPEDMDRLFQRFSRLEPVSAKSQAGVGLGLYFVQVTAQKHQGVVHVSSRQGSTTFTMSLPCKGAV